MIVGYKIFILEGLLTVVVSVGAYFVVPTWSFKARFVDVIPINSAGSVQLTEQERVRLPARLQADSDAGKDEKFDWYYVRRAMSNHLV